MRAGENHDHDHAQRRHLRVCLRAEGADGRSWHPGQQGLENPTEVGGEYAPEEPFAGFFSFCAPRCARPPSCCWRWRLSSSIRISSACRCSSLPTCWRCQGWRSSLRACRMAVPGWPLSAWPSRPALGKTWSSSHPRSLRPLPGSRPTVSRGRHGDLRWLLSPGLIPLGLLVILWDRHLAPAHNVRDMGLSEGVRFDPHALSLYLAAPGAYLLPLVVSVARKASPAVDRAN